MGVIRWLLISSVCFVLIVFGVENMHEVDLNFSFFKFFDFHFQIELFLVIIVSVFAGAALAGLLGLADHIRLRALLRKQRKAVALLEDEVKSLRNLPLEEEGEESLPAITDG